MKNLFLGALLLLAVTAVDEVEYVDAIGEESGLGFTVTHMADQPLQMPNISLVRAAARRSVDNFVDRHGEDGTE